MKNRIIRFFHAILGWENYLFVFTVFKIYTLRRDKRKKDYLFFTKQFAPDANVLVIGACTGITTVPLAKEIKKGTVTAFEPVPFNFNAVNKAVKFFGLKNVQALQTALGNANGTIEMVLPIIEHTKKQGFAHVIDPAITEYNEGTRFTVPLRRLDDIAELSNVPTAGIKIVAENYEKQIFLGAKEFIKKNKPLIYCELWDNANRAVVMELIKSYGYNIMVSDGKKLVDYDPKVHKEKFFFFKAI